VASLHPDTFFFSPWTVVLLAMELVTGSNGRVETNLSVSAPWMHGRIIIFPTTHGPRVESWVQGF
jgi:hypothetical protein